jgi:co-chaperonin GroES (HSP10)
MPFMRMVHAEDPKQTLKNNIGNIDEIEIFNNQILVAIYIRPQKTVSGIYLPDNMRDEDKNQSKVGLVLKKGPQAFVDDKNQWFAGVDIHVDDWIFFRPSEGWPLIVNNVMCRILEDVDVRGRIPNPDDIW